MEDHCSSFIPTRCSSLKNTAVPYQEVVFKNPRRKTQKSINIPPTDSNKTPEVLSHDKYGQEFNMKLAKYEMKKFARSNVKLSNKQKTYRELALELGARPQRRTAVNYKELLAKNNKQKKKELRLLESITNGKTVAKPKRKKPKPEIKDRSGLLHVYGKVKIPKNQKKKF